MCLQVWRTARTLKCGSGAQCKREREARELTGEPPKPALGALTADPEAMEEMLQRFCLCSECDERREGFEPGER